LRESLRACIRALDADADASDWRTLNADEFFETQGCYSFDVFDEDAMERPTLSTDAAGAALTQKPATSDGSSWTAAAGEGTTPAAVVGRSSLLDGGYYASSTDTPAVVTVRTRRRVVRQMHSHWVRRMQQYATLTLTASAVQSFPSAEFTPQQIACYQAAAAATTHTPGFA